MTQVHIDWLEKVHAVPFTQNLLYLPCLEESCWCEDCLGSMFPLTQGQERLAEDWELMPQIELIL